jgi:hypothetical protein
MAALFVGTLSIDKNKSITLDEIEKLLGFEPESIVDIWYGVEFYVYGRDIPATFHDPAEYAELDDITISFIEIKLNHGKSVFPNDAQFNLLEEYLPRDEELYWNIIGDTQNDE